MGNTDNKFAAHIALLREMVGDFSREGVRNEVLAGAVPEEWEKMYANQASFFEHVASTMYDVTRTLRMPNIQPTSTGAVLTLPFKGVWVFADLNTAHRVLRRYNAAQKRMKKS